MKLEDQVVSLVLSMQLKKLGVKQQSIFYWDYFNPKAYGVRYAAFHCPSLEHYSAFTVAELGEMIPTKYDEMFLTSYKCSREGWWVEYDDGKGEKSDFTSWSKNEADSRAKFLIYMIENNLLKKEEL